MHLSLVLICGWIACSWWCWRPSVGHPIFHWSRRPPLPVGLQRLHHFNGSIWKPDCELIWFLGVCSDNKRVNGWIAGAKRGMVVRSYKKQVRAVNLVERKFKNTNVIVSCLCLLYFTLDIQWFGLYLRKWLMDVNSQRPSHVFPTIMSRHWWLPILHCIGHQLNPAFVYYLALETRKLGLTKLSTH